MLVNIKLLIIDLILLFIIGPFLPFVEFLIVENYIKNPKMFPIIVLPFSVITIISFIYGLICIFHAVKREFNW